MDGTDDRRHMRRALELAERGRGSVEPNPMVGCVIVAGDGQVVGEGWHRRYGGAHAEIEALRVAGEKARGARMFVTLEPCCHHGQTPPCSEAIIAAGVREVQAALVDPFPRVAGGGLRRLQSAGVTVATGLLADEARELNAPYWKLTTRGQPWVIAKWAMTLDGKTATRAGDSRWISNEASRRVVHRLRGEVDAILVGRGTVSADDPLLTARPPGPRTATRIVLDSDASLPLGSQLVRTVAEAPVLVVTSRTVNPGHRNRLERAGCEVLPVDGQDWPQRLPGLLDHLGQRRMTRVLLEGGATTLGGFWDARAVDEVHVFVAPRLIGGSSAPGPLGGTGASHMADAIGLDSLCVEPLDGDIYIRGRVRPRTADQTDRPPHRPANR